jgi:hypothetical protein
VVEKCSLMLCSKLLNKTDSIPFALVAGGKVSKVVGIRCCEPSLAQGSVASCLGQCANDTATVAEETVMYTALTKGTSICVTLCRTLAATSTKLTSTNQTREGFVWLTL